MSRQGSGWLLDSRTGKYYVEHSDRYIYSDGKEIMKHRDPRTTAQISRNVVSTSQHYNSPSGQSNAYHLSTSPPGGSTQAPAASLNTGQQVKNVDIKPREVPRDTERLAQEMASTSLSGNVTTAQGNLQQKWTDEGGRSFVNVLSPLSKVQTTLQTAPWNQFTDPALLKKGVRATEMLIATEGAAEKLIGGYRRREQPKHFFTFGKVFRVLWSEPAGDTRTIATFVPPGSSRARSQEQRSITTGRFGEPVHSKVRLFIVIREGDTYCSALSIVTYSHQGVAKPSVTKSEHSVVYSGRSPPSITPDEEPHKGEQGMREDAIRVNLDDKADPLHDMSRLDYGKVYTVQHNIKVKPYGQVHPGSLAALRSQFWNVWLPDDTSKTSSRSTTNDVTFAATTAPEHASTEHHQRPRYHSLSTHSNTNSGKQATVASADAASTLQEQAQAAVSRLVKQGLTREAAVRMVQETARARQTSRRASDAVEGVERGSGGASSRGSDDGNSVGRNASEQEHQNLSQQAGRIQQHPPRVDSRPHGEQYSRPQGDPRSTTATRSAQASGSGQTYTQSRSSASDRAKYQTSMYDHPPSQNRLHQDGEWQPPHHSGQRMQQDPQAPAQTQQAQIEAAIQRLMIRGMTRQQATQHVAATIAAKRQQP